MREYETVYIASPQLSDAQVAQINQKIKGIVERFDGRLFFARNLGKKNLAYRIKKQTKGIYFCLDFAAAGQCVNEIERNLMLDENVLRFLTVVKADKVDVDARAAEIEARGEAAAHAAEEETTRHDTSDPTPSETAPKEE